MRLHYYHALLAMNTRKTCIRSKSTGYFFRNFIVMFHTFGTSFLIAAHDEANSFIQFHSRITEKFHCIKCLQDRSLIICRTTSINMVSITGKSKRIICPVTAYRHNIKMSGNSNDFLSFSHLCISTVIVQIYGLKTKFISNLKAFLQSLCRSFTKRHSLCRST